MNVVKSLIVLICVLALMIYSCMLICKLITRFRTGDFSLRTTLFAVCFVGVTFFAIAFFGEYVYPFERTVEPVLVAEFEVPDGYELDYPGQKFWHGAYERYGLYAESFYFNPDETVSMYGFGWPPMDFDRYNYIITYGQRIDKLSYCVWDTIDDPVRTGAKVGHMVLNKSFEPKKVYIYQIPKIRIENDVNDVNRTWD